ncbi:MAG TPA: hypothetical protein VIL74_14430 [Pyrinomonadaceae bacterium]|jgi:hypothetical protein
MKNIQKRLIGAALFAALVATALAGKAFGGNYNEINRGCKKSAEAKGGASETEASLTKCVSKKDEGLVGRTAFSKTVAVNLNGSGVSVVAMQIPAGKRLVIEKVTAIVRGPESQRVEVDYMTYTGTGGVAGKTVHRLVLEKQASFKDSAIFTADRSEVVFADERIGGEHFSVGISARLTGAVGQPAQAQFKFSGYLEDLPAV